MRRESTQQPFSRLFFKRQAEKRAAHHAAAFAAAGQIWHDEHPLQRSTDIEHTFRLSGSIEENAESGEAARERFEAADAHDAKWNAEYFMASDPRYKRMNFSASSIVCL